MSTAMLLVRALDLVGTFAFALSGATLGVQKSFDLFGVLVLAFVTAVVGGIVRDLLIGAVPPASVASWHNLALAFVAGLLVFRFHPWIDRLQQPVLVFDAVGLGVFAVAGTQKALDHGINWPMAAVLGVVSAVGGGMARDGLAAQVPTVLRADIYAVAALAGAIVVIVGSILDLPSVAAAVTGIGVCVFLRLMALQRGWRLPVAPSSRP